MKYTLVIIAKDQTKVNFFFEKKNLIWRESEDYLLFWGSTKTRCGGRSLVVRASLTSTDQFQSFRTSYELREFSKSRPNLTSVVRVSKTPSCTSFPERLTTPCSADFQSVIRILHRVARVCQSILCRIVVRVYKSRSGK